MQSQLEELSKTKAESEALAAAKSADVEAAIFTEVMVTARQNVFDWFRFRGPKVLATILLLLISWVVVQLVGRLLLYIVSKFGDRDTSDRMQSLIHLVRSALTVVILIGGFLLTLSFSGVAVGPLLGGAAVAGVAVAFASQNLIRDYFHGIIMMLENQYTINDNVIINDLNGTVEAITLRLTVLRDFEGNLHFIPNGEITAVTNL